MELGSCYVLVVLPIWATALIMYMVTVGMIFVLRDRNEGLFYNTSYSAMIGDGALVCIVLMAAGILQHEVSSPFKASLPLIVLSGWFHFFALMVGITLGVGWLVIDQPKQWGDRYHHAVVAPLLAYLGITLLPVIFWNGKNVEMVATICLVLVWVVLVIYDGRNHRLDQRNYNGLGGHLYAIKKEKMEKLGWRHSSH